MIDGSILPKTCLAIVGRFGGTFLTGFAGRRGRGPQSVESAGPAGGNR